MSTTTTITVSQATIPTIDATFILDANGVPEGLLLKWSDDTVQRVMVADLPDLIQYTAQVHGLKQKLLDAAAISRDKGTGASANIETKRAALTEVLDRLMAGRWNKGRAEGSGGSREGGLLARAVAEVTGISVEDAKAKLATYTTEQKKALSLNDRVKLVIDRLLDEADKIAARGIDSDELLAGFGA